MAEKHFSKSPVSAVSEFLRGRWSYGSVGVFDLDCIIRSPDGLRGIAAEWKLDSAPSKIWQVTREIGRAMNHHAAGSRWWGALIVYRTNTGGLKGTIIEPLELHYEDPEGNRGVEKLTFAQFDQWVIDAVGAQPKNVAA